jgi:HD-like signal output (HDOD) protein
VLLTTKPRSALSASELEAMLGSLGQKLDQMGIETQPEVANRILRLVSDPNAGLRKHADVVKSDPALTGRLLRLANSAFFAQRQPVTNLERACVLLGLERLKAISLGFYLSKGAAGDANGIISRRVWGESVYRACLASELARTIAPRFAAEAFIVGLMLDSGIPLTHKLLAKQAASIFEKTEPPTRLFKEEYGTLPFTHVDVVTALARRFRLPELIAKPLEWHHVQPAPTDTPSPVQMLHRVSYYVGAIQLDVGALGEPAPKDDAPLSGVAEKMLGIRSDRLGGMVKAAGAEYGAVIQMFNEVADSMGNMADHAERIHVQLTGVLDQALADQFRKETERAGQVFELGEQHVEVELDALGRVAAYLKDSSGIRLLSCTLDRGDLDVQQIYEALGIEDATDQQTYELQDFLKLLAA